MSKQQDRSTILVVDDQLDNIEMFNQFLDNEYRVLVATNGPTGLSIAREQSPDLILLDVIMPEMDGYQVCRELKADPQTRDIPVIFITGMELDKDQEKGFSVGGADYLTKPVRPAILKMRVCNQLHISNNIAERKKAEQMLVASMVGLTGQKYFDKVTSELCKFFDSAGAIIGELIDGERIRAISMELDGEKVLDYEYALEGTPCNNVVSKGACIYTKDAYKLFPNDKDIVELKVEGYAGTPILDFSGSVIGLVWVVSRKPLHVAKWWKDVLSIIAAKASVEIEHMRAEEKIKGSLKEKEILLREVHHRVKNNMQVIISLLNLQARRTRNKEAVDALQDSRQRVRTIATAHEKFYRSRDFANIKLSDYISSLVIDIQQLFATVADRVTVQTQVADLAISMDQAIPLGLIVNELVVNAKKHAFPEGRSGTLTVSIQPNGEDEVVLVVADDGVGLPEDLDWQHAETMGLMLITDLSQQIQGDVSLDRSNGTCWKIIFKWELS